MSAPLTEVTASGPPKAGTHALVKSCRLLGLSCTSGMHCTSNYHVSGPHIFIKRDPRNMVVSWLRWTGRHVTPITFIEALSKFYNGQPFVHELRQYEAWLADPTILTVSYERLMCSDLEMRRIAEYCGVQYVAGAFEQLPGSTRTWRDGKSDYKAVWTPAVAAAWEAHGGADMIAAWGYR